MSDSFKLASLRRRGTGTAKASDKRPNSASGCADTSPATASAKTRRAPADDTPAAATVTADGDVSDEDDLSSVSDGVRMMRAAVDAEIAHIESQPDATLWEALKGTSSKRIALVVSVPYPPILNHRASL